MSTTLSLAIVISLLAVSHSVDGAGDKGMYLNREAFLDRNIEETTNELASEMRVHCTTEGIDITFRRNKTMHLGVVSPMQLQLATPSCKARANVSHFTLHTGFLKCGTNFVLSNNKSTAIINNTVTIIPPTMFFAQDQSFQGDESRKVEISFTCTYSDKTQSTTAQERTTVRSPLAIHRSNIKLYTTDSFTKEVDLDLPVARGTSLYAEVSAYQADGQAAGFYVDSCYMSLKSYPGSLDTPHYLIKNGCAVDDDVQFKEDTTSTPRKFLFRAKRVFGKKPMYLHCTLLLCSSSTQDECLRQQDYCWDRTGDLDSLVYRAKLSQEIVVVKRQPVIATTTTTQQVTKVETTTTRTTPPMRRKPCPPVTQPACKCEKKVVIDVPTPSPQAQHSMKGMVSIEVTVVVAVMSFVIGAAFIALMWFIYIKTDPRRKMKAVSMSEDGMSSSQDSTVPTEKLMRQCNDVTSSEGSH